MIPYFLLLSFVMSWIYLEKIALNRKSFVVPFFALVLFASVRSYLIGSDTETYTSDFRDQLDPNYFVFNDNVEYGFQLLKYWLLNLTYNYFWLFFVSAIIVVCSYLFIFKKLSRNYWLSVFIFITFNYYTFFFNGLRQGIAMAIIVLATPYLIKKEFLKYFLIVLIASLFHISSLIMILFYFIIKLKLKLEYKLLGVILSSLILSGLSIQYLATSNERYSTYSEVSENSGGYLTLMLYLIIGGMIYLFIKKYKTSDIIFINLTQLYLCGVAFLIPIAMLGVNPSGPQRLLYYFTWSIALIFPYIFSIVNNKIIYYLFIVFSCIYFYLFTSEYAGLSPYSLNEIFRIF